MSKIQFDSNTLTKVTDTIEKNLSEFLKEPLTKILDESKDGLSPLIGFYIAAKKGKEGITKKIAKDVTSKIIAAFADDFIPEGLSSLSVDVDKQKDGENFSPNYSPYDKDISLIFKINETNPPVVHEEKMIFNFSLSGGFNDLKLKKDQSNKRNLKFGGLGGDLTIVLNKLPFIEKNKFVKKTLFEKNISIELSQFTAEII